ncbi:hypothetical protein AB6A40_000628 [Gnathostoma spinigerum]|uniref:Winged helix Storkhead-box1 domain-containing protein n=1 Tax=Gnathostoma spinigerum TaxID=75299 RepID=A0ABD6E2G6_9BILA
MSLPISTQCLAIVFQTSSLKTKSGHKIFESFVEENRSCFWNLELVEAVLNLEYVGFMRPGTLFVSSSSHHHLNALRSAWARRILKPARGFIIVSFGDIGGIEIQEVEQLHFVPLADIVCDAVARLNRIGRPATLDSLRSEIGTTCSTVSMPSGEMIRQTISSLKHTGLLYSMGDHLFLSLPASAPYHTLKPQLKCTVECQTGKSIIDGNDPTDDHLPSEVTSKNKKGIFARLFNRKSSPAKTSVKRSRPKTFSAQFPPPEWICNPNLLTKEINPYQTDKLQTKRYCTFAENLCDEVEVRRSSRVRRHRRGERHLSSSSECLNYGPIDPPECLPEFADAEVVEDLTHRRKRLSKRRDERFAITHHRQQPARTSTPVGKGSDSAYSVSPIITETSVVSKDKYSSWSGSELPNADCVGSSAEHTYINIETNNEKTHFEDVTQVEKALQTSLHVTNL